MSGKLAVQLFPGPDRKRTTASEARLTAHLNWRCVTPALCAGRGSPCSWICSVHLPLFLLSRSLSSFGPRPLV